MRLPLPRAVCLLLLACAPTAALPLRAQRTTPVCSLTTGELRRIVLRDGSFGMIFPAEMLARGDSVLILGLGVTVDSAGKPITLAGDDSLLVGFLLTNHRSTATAIPAPHNMTTARYFRTLATGNGWETVFFVPDRDTVPGARLVDDGTFWYARLQGRHWTGLERIGHVDSAIVARPGASGLTSRWGMLQFAVGRGSPMALAGSGSVLIFRRERRGAWRADTLRTKGPSLYVSTPAENATLPDAPFLSVAGGWDSDDWIPGSLLWLDATKRTPWRLVRRGNQSMNNPVELVVGSTMHTSWWEEAQDGIRPSVWYQALDPFRKNDPARRHIVVEGVTSFTFLAVPEGERIRPVWTYQLPGRGDSAEVAVVANGEPVSIGRMAFPFGFMTNGVTSGDRSFILATTPRPIPGEGPPASRTLEVRVDCRGASGTSTGGTNEAPVEDARTGWRAGNHRMH